MAKAVRKPGFDVEAFLASVDGGRTVKEYHKGEKVFSQGDDADALFYVQKGKTKVTVISPQGKEAVVAIHSDGDFFGEGCLAGQPKRLGTVVAMTDAVIMRLGKVSVVRLLIEEQTFSERFIVHLLARNARVEGDLVDQLFNSSGSAWPEFSS